MLRSVFEMWKGKDFVKTVMDYFREMLIDTHDMYDVVCKELFYEEEQPQLRDTIYRVDKNVNSLEKEIRKRVIEHLSFRPGDDVSLCLVLMSVVKDAERVGDYAKNLFEVTRLLNHPLKKEKYPAVFAVQERIEYLFGLTKAAFLDSNLEKAHECWNIKKDINCQCDEIIEHLAKSSRPVNEAVCYTLIVRYLKRITSHLTNIATSVILPVSELDYFDERLSGRER